MHDLWRIDSAVGRDVKALEERNVKAKSPAFVWPLTRPPAADDRADPPGGRDAMRMCVRRLIFPGVGAFGAAMDVLESRGFAAPLREYLASGERPFLGICIGMQVRYAPASACTPVARKRMYARRHGRSNVQHKPHGNLHALAG